MLPLFALFAIAGGVVYQIAIKKIPTSANAFLMLLGAYGLAAALALIAYVALPAAGLGGPGVDKSGTFTKWSLLLGAGIFLIELGYVLSGSYKIDISLFAPIVFGAVVAGTALVGIFVFGESASPMKLAGVAVCVAGIVLIKAAH